VAVDSVIHRSIMRATLQSASRWTGCVAALLQPILLMIIAAITGESCYIDPQLPLICLSARQS